jgi:NAD+ diphosphatase
MAPIRLALTSVPEMVTARLARRPEHVLTPRPDLSGKTGYMFLPLFEPPGSPERDALVFAVRSNEVAIHRTYPSSQALFLGVLNGQQCWAVDADAHGDVAESTTYQDLRQLWNGVDEITWTVAGRGVQLVEWARTTRFCGRCGDQTENSPGERARRCPSCASVAFPRLAPAVICLIERDGKALLARNANFPAGMYSCLAGFVEPGETLEQAVAREVAEEVGVEVADIRYFASQPWPFPHSLMVGFTATWCAGELCVDGSEIVEAAWFAPDEFPAIPPPISIARRMIDDWATKAVPDLRSD